LFSHGRRKEGRKNPHLASSIRKDPTILNFGDCLVGIWRVFGNCQEFVWREVGTDQVRTGQVKTDQVRTGQVRTGPFRTWLLRTGLFEISQVGTF